MLLALDRGNTNDKFVVFDDDKIVFDSSKIISHNKELKCEISEIISRINFLLCDKKSDITQCVFSSVRSVEENKEFIEKIERYCPVIQIKAETNLPFKSIYKSKTIGIDRLAAVAGANKLFGTNVLVIDVGTCVTFDYLNKENVYMGGSISPGIAIKYKSLHNFTANLPLISKIDYTDFISDTTQGCIKSGVVGGTVAEIEQTISLYRKRFSDIKIIITGGDSSFIKSKLNSDIIEEKNIIFWGLKNIYEFNEYKKK